MDPSVFSGLTYILENNLGDLTLASTSKKSRTENLADIFEPEQTMDNNSEKSLKYIPPKATETDSAKKSDWSVEMAKSITAYKLTNGENKSVGKLGLAILKHSNDDNKKIILYKSKTMLCSSTVLTKTTKFFWNSSYLQYRDDAHICWSLHFDNTESSNDILSIIECNCILDRMNENKASTSNIVDVETVKSDTNENKPISDLVNRVAKIGLQLPKLSDNVDSNASVKDETAQNVFDDLFMNRIVKQKCDCSEASTISLPRTPTSFETAMPYETRLQNAEIRMNIMRLDTKMDRVLDNIERLQLNASKNAADGVDNEEEMFKLEEKLLDLKKENRQLKLQLNKIEQNKTDDSNVNETVVQLQKTVQEKNSEIIELKEKIQELEGNLQKENVSKKELLTKVEHNYKVELDKLRDELKKKDETLQANSKQTDNKSNNEIILGIMNQMYIKIYSAVDGKGPIESADLLKIIAEIIRKETKTALNQ